MDVEALALVVACRVPIQLVEHSIARTRDHQVEFWNASDADWGQERWVLTVRGVAE